METPDVDDNEDLRNGSRSSSTSVEDLLRDTLLTARDRSDVSSSISNTSFSSSGFERDSALDNSQSSLNTLRSSPQLNSSLDDSHRSDDWLRGSADNLLQESGDSRRSSVDDLLG
ncbi:unnamed protein product, partial [Lymnaea stagnalis]